MFMIHLRKYGEAKTFAHKIIITLLKLNSRSAIKFQTYTSIFEDSWI